MDSLDILQLEANALNTDLSLYTQQIIDHGLYYTDVHESDIDSDAMIEINEDISISISDDRYFTVTVDEHDDSFSLYGFTKFINAINKVKLLLNT